MANRYVWTAADGVTSIDLTDYTAGYAVMDQGTTGFRSVKYAFASTQYAGTDGATVQAIRAEANTPTIGLFVSALDATEFRAKARGLVRAMRPKAGPGTLTVTTDAGESRSLTCYYTEGLEGDEARSVLDPNRRWWRMVLKFLAPDPWWRGTPRTIDTGLGTAPNFFPFFPMQLAASTIQGQFSVDLSDADAPSYPLWTITGPGSALTLTNNTTGRSIQVNADIPAGSTVVIDTRPGFQSVRRGDGTNLMGSLSSDPALWPLVESVNDVSALMTGTTSASRIVGTYTPRFAGI